MLARCRHLRSAVNGVHLNSQLGATAGITWKERATDDAINHVFKNKYAEKRIIPVQMRNSGDARQGKGGNVHIDTRIRKGPFWHLSDEAGAWSYITYNKIYLPKAFILPEDGGCLKEYEYLTQGVTLWDVAVERQIQVKGPDAEKFVDMVITRRADSCPAGKCKYVILTNQYGGILNDPIMLRPNEDEFWFSISDSDISMYLQGVNAGLKMDVDIHEIDVAPVQIQGPKSIPFMQDLFGPEVANLNYYDLAKAKIAGCDVVISRTGYSAEKGYEIYLYDAMLNAEKMWYAIREAGKKFDLQLIGPSYMRRIEAGILSYGKDIDIETNPYQCGLGWQVDLKKDDFIGKEALAEIKRKGVTHKCVGLTMGGTPHMNWNNEDHYHCMHNGDVIGPVTSAVWSPELQTNIGIAKIPTEFAAIGTKVEVALPRKYNDTGRPVPAEVVKTPFKMPDKAEEGTGLRLTGAKL